MIMMESDSTQEAPQESPESPDKIEISNADIVNSWSKWKIKLYTIDVGKQLYSDNLIKSVQHFAAMYEYTKGTTWKGPQKYILTII